MRQQQAQADAAKMRQGAGMRRGSRQRKIWWAISPAKSGPRSRARLFCRRTWPAIPQAEFDVTLMPTGEVLNLKLTRSSGSSAYDSAVERAIYKAQPLPLPPDPTLFGEFRELHLKFRLHED